MKREYYLANKERIIAQNLEYQRKNKDKVREWNRASCQRRKSYFVTWREKHRMANREATKRYHERLKVEVLTHYGNGVFACVKCGENRFPCLSIDHINGGGTIHREVTGHGSKMYRWLKKNDYPEGYQTLCMNCQWIKKYEEREYRGIGGKL